MITTVTKILTLNLAMMMVLIKNPVKLSMAILATSMLIFLQMALGTGSSWFPILFSLLFMGGILMMFMILSSILPNEKSIKMKNYPFIIMFTFAALAQSFKVQDFNSPFIAMKSFLSSGSNFLVMTLILALYFFTVIAILCKEEMPMRMSMKTCCKSKI